MNQIVWVQIVLSLECGVRSVAFIWQVVAGSGAVRVSQRKMKPAAVWMIVQVWIDRDLNCAMERNRSHGKLPEGKGSWGRERKSWSWRLRPGEWQALSWEKEQGCRNGGDLGSGMLASTFKWWLSVQLEDVCQIVGNVELKLRKYRSGGEVREDVKAVEVKDTLKRMLVLGKGGGLRQNFHYNNQYLFYTLVMSEHFLKCWYSSYPLSCNPYSRTGIFYYSREVVTCPSWIA